MVETVERLNVQKQNTQELAQRSQEQRKENNGYDYG